MLERLREIIGLEYFHNSVARYAIALAVCSGVFFGILLFRYLAVRRFAEFEKRTKTNIGALIAWPFALGAGLAAGSQLLVFPPQIARILAGFFIILFTYYGARTLSAVVDFAMARAARRRSGAAGPLDPSIFHLLGSIAKVLISVFAVLLILQNLGYEVSTLIAGLGIGGIAVAFALQNTLGDIFAAISIYLDKPFSVGDFIVIGTDMGRVKSIGLKSTRLETPQGQELIISNKQLTEQRVQNFRRMLERHVTLHIAVSRETSDEALRTVPEIIRKTISEIESCETEHVFLREITEQGALYEVEYKVAQGTFDLYARTRQEIILALKAALEKAGIEFIGVQKGT